MRTILFLSGKMRMAILSIAFLLPLCLPGQAQSSKKSIEADLPNAPSYVRLNPASYNYVKISWRDNSDNEDGFEIQRTLDGTNYGAVKTVPANTEYYIDENVNVNTPYIYRICAVKSGQKSAYVQSNPIITPRLKTITSLMDGRRYSASDEHKNSATTERVANLFDGNTSTKFVTKASSAWVQIKFNESVKVELYSLTSASDSPLRDPRDWTLEASNDGTNWTLLDTKKEQVFTTRDRKMYFDVNNQTAYYYYRLNINQNNGDENIQLADWLLYADVPAVGTGNAPSSPVNFKLNVRSCSYIELNWSAPANTTSYKMERYANGVLDTTFVIQGEDTKFRSYALKPETNYEYKLYALNVDKTSSSPAIASGTTLKEEWKNELKGINSWITDNLPVDVVKVKEMPERYVAFYMPASEDPSIVSDVIFDAYSENWKYVADTYGDLIGDRRLHALLLPTNASSGGAATIYTFDDSRSQYCNMVFVKIGRNEFKTTTKAGFAYDVMSHEICHIIEGIGGGYSGSMFYPVWGDSKWAEIFQYDIFKGVMSPRAETWFQGYMNPSPTDNGDNYPTAGRKQFWFRDFLYPTYTHGQTTMLTNFWNLMNQHYKHKNGSFIETSSNPGGRGNLGEMIHFFSGAAGVDVKPYAENAFGWNDQYEMWLLKARADYPGIIYDDMAIQGVAKKVKNICQNGGTIISNITSSDNIENLIDLKNNTGYAISKGSNNSFSIVYSSTSPVLFSGYRITLLDKNLVPASWIVYGSNNNKEWNPLDEQTTPKFNASGTQYVVKKSEITYQYYKIEFVFPASGQLNLAEIELEGIEYPTAPCDLRIEKLSESSAHLSWIGNLEGLTHYEIERSANGVDFERIADVSKYEISYIDQSVGATATYYYRVVGRNKDAQEDATSNVVSVALVGSGIINIESKALTFYDIVYNLDQYPNNTIQVYSIDGKLAYSKYYGKRNLLEQLQSELNPGVYIIRINIGDNRLPSVCNKVIVR